MGAGISAQAKTTVHLKIFTRHKAIVAGKKKGSRGNII
jgi:hypothetical protein